ncbi:hypothetical protein DPM19_18125 [Actinomadura craniellae]|uniref:Uncharacterized protein n=1 Tax=Actinomadura craniellae TaxID=2231787 RepID=A0A365H3J7_9ACTN|nr:hypothetical protein DPM19_18125 [Actinomadura craniellae]
MRFIWVRTYARHRPDLCDQALRDGEAGVMVLIWDAWLDGRETAAAGEPATSCPHDPRAGTALGRAVFSAWCRGYAEVRPPPVDYTG